MSSEPRRLHPAAVAAEAVAAFTDLAMPVAIAGVLAVSGSGSVGGASLRVLALAVLAALAACIGGVVKWRHTSYRVADGAVRLRTGLLNVNETSIPIERVQSVDEVRGPVQRLFDVVELQIQAAGGGRQAEIQLRALSQQAAEELRGALTSAPTTTDREEEEEEDLQDAGETMVLDRRMLVVAAMTSGQLGLVLPLVAAAAQTADRSLTSSLAEEVPGMLPGAAGAVLIAAIVALIAWLLAVTGAIVAFAGFTVSRSGDRIRVERGLVQRRRATVPVERVHAVRVVEGVLRRPFGLAQLYVETAGYAAEPAAARTLFPVLRTSEVPELMRRMLPELADDLDRLAPPPARARRRYVLPALVPAVALGVAAALALWPFGAAALLLVPAVALHGLTRHRTAGWRLERGRLVVRFLRLARTTVVATAGRLEERRTSANPLQRRADLASFGFALGSRSRFGVAHLENEVGAALLRNLRAPGASQQVPE